MFAELCASQRGVRLLHGDLQHYNVLFDRRRGWVSIDPKGVLGEPEYEIGAALRNPARPALYAVRAIVERGCGATRTGWGWTLGGSWRGGSPKPSSPPSGASRTASRSC